MEEEIINQACVKVRLFGNEEKLLDESIKEIAEEIGELLYNKGFNNNEFLSCVVTVNPKDIIPYELDEEELSHWLIKDEESALIIVKTEKDMLEK
jgi:hypothetical protein